jgi:alkaline phosphatase
MPVGGLIDTQGSDHEVTGSAPSATALATGVRSFMGALGVGPDSLPRETSLEVAHARGWATGLVTTTWIVDATPAAFAAHVSSRAERVEIFRQMTSLPVHVLLGGGSRVLAQAQAQAGRDLLRAVEARYTLVPNAAALGSVVTDTTTTLFGLFAPGEMSPAPERSPTLPDMTRAALSVLERDPDGFFLMVENEGTDSYAHQNLSRRVITAEMLDFDAAVGVALEYQSAHPETLVVVTADHETGGIQLAGDPARDLVLGYATTSHTAALVPLFAIGPGSERLGGLKRNDEIGQSLIDLVRSPTP